MTRWQPTHCPVCRRLLLHRAGAAILLCPSCHSLLNLHAHPSTPGQTACSNCTSIIHHPIGPPLLQCRMCAATTPAPVLNYVCRGCSLYLAYSSTLPAVVCPICHTVEPPMDAPLSRIPVLLPFNPASPPRPCPSLPPRYIPWLPSTPVRPVSGPRPPQHPRVPQQPRIPLPSSQLEVPVPSSSVHIPPGPLGPLPETRQSIQYASMHQAAPSAATSVQTHQQQLYEPESVPEHLQHVPEAPHHAEDVPLNGGKVSMNGGNNDSIDNNNQLQGTQSSSLTPSSKMVEPESDSKD